MHTSPALSREPHFTSTPVQAWVAATVTAVREDGSVVTDKGVATPAHLAVKDPKPPKPSSAPKPKPVAKKRAEALAVGDVVQARDTWGDTAAITDVRDTTFVAGGVQMMPDIAGLNGTDTHSTHQTSHRIECRQLRPVTLVSCCIARICMCAEVADFVQ